MTIGLVITAFTLGLRHGVDWDHIAAIADLTSTTEDRKRGFMLSLWYALGHAAVVLFLGILAIALSASIPESLDAWMGRVVGATLLVLGIWVLIDMRRSGDDFRLKSRWMLVLGGTFAGLRRVRNRGGRRAIELEHDHDHEHDGELDHGGAPAHDHAHETIVDARDGEPAVAGGGGLRSRFGWPGSGHVHQHPHRHQVDLPASADGSSAGVAGGVGMLHGVGIESPTQIAIFVASTSATGNASGIALLVAWCVGLVVANAGLAIAAGQGLLQPGRNAKLYRALAFVVAIASIALGIFYILG